MSQRVARLEIMLELCGYTDSDALADKIIVAAMNHSRALITGLLRNYDADRGYAPSLKTHYLLSGQMVDAFWDNK